MYDVKNKKITFPHVIPGNTLGGKVHEKLKTEMAMVVLANLGIDRNTFFGGRCENIGMIREYGIYACVDYMSNEIIGFYVHNPMDVTKIGKTLLQARFPDCKIVYEAELVKEGLTDEEIAEKERLIDEAKRRGYSPERLTSENAETIKNLLDIFDAGGRAEKPMATPENVVLSPSVNAGEKPITIMADLPNEILEGAQRAKRALKASQ